MMNRFGWWVVVGACVVFGAVWFVAGEYEGGAAGAPATRTVAAPASGAPTAPLATSGMNAMAAEPAPAVSPSAVSPSQVSKWVEEVQSADAAKRAAAIQALAAAPRELALPVLRNQLVNGEPQVDRPLALKSLRTLALRQGDRDGQVREAIREVIYHNDDQNPTLAAHAQGALDDVEKAEQR